MFHFYRIIKLLPDWSRKIWFRLKAAKGLRDTFYHHAHNTGIIINKITWFNNFIEDQLDVQPVTQALTLPVIQTDTNIDMPTFSDSLFFQLPEFPQKVVEPASRNEERDILLIGSITALSACFPKLSALDSYYLQFHQVHNLQHRQFVYCFRELLF